MALAGSQQLRAQDPTPVRRCGTEGRSGHQGWEGGNGDGNKDRGGDGNENEDRHRHENKDGGGNGNGNGNEKTERVEGRESLGTYEVIVEVGDRR